MGEIKAKSDIFNVDENAAFEPENRVSAVTVDEVKEKIEKFENEGYM